MPKSIYDAAQSDSDLKKKICEVFANNVLFNEDVMQQISKYAQYHHDL